MSGVGTALAKAFEHALAHERTHTRRLRVRIFFTVGDYGVDGLAVTAHIAARTPEDLDAQANNTIRIIPFAELEARVQELPAMIDSCVAEASQAVGMRADA